MVIMREVTVPWVDYQEEAHERKFANYQKLIEQFKSLGWGTICEPTEVDCQRFSGL